MLTWMQDAWARLRGSFHRDTGEHEMREEFAFHLEQATARNIARGMSPDDAARAARRGFGDAELHRDSARGEQRSISSEALMHDLWYAGRMLRRRPGLTTAIVLTVALGLAAATAIFSTIDAVLLRPLPFPDADRVSYVQFGFGDGKSDMSLSRYEIEFLRARVRGFDGLATYQTAAYTVGDPQQFVELHGLRVSHDFLRVTGASVARGRAFDTGELELGGRDVVMLSDAVWRGRFAADAAIAGKAIRLDDRPYTVIGVLAPGFRMPDVPDNADFLLPLRVAVDASDEGRNFIALARRKADVSDVAIRAELDAVSAQYREQHPNHVYKGASGFSTTSFQTVFVGDLASLLWILFGAVALVVLIGCVNAANLILASNIGREREVAVRMALGSGRARIVRQLLIESLLLASGASALGLLLGTIGLAALLRTLPQALMRSEEIGLSWRVMAFAATSALITGVVFGVAAALPSTRTSVLSTLTRAGTVSRAGSTRLRKMLIVTEVAGATVLLASAGLLLTSFNRLRNIDPGFDATGLLTVRMNQMPKALTTDDQLWNHQRAVLERLRGTPGVEVAAAVPNFPLERGINMPMTIEGRPDASEGAIEVRDVSEGYFEAFRIPMTRGRAFDDERDRRGSLRVGVVNAAFVARYWPGENPIGKRVELGRWHGEWLAPGFEGAIEIVGVVGDIRESGLSRTPRRTLYVPRSQWAIGSTRYVVRTPVPAALAPRLSEIVRSVDARVAPPTISTMPAIVSQSIARERFQTLVLMTFAASALVLTIIGIYGVVAAMVGQRTREIGIRMALGAEAGQVVRRLLGEGMRLVLAGLAIGLALTFAVTRYLASMLYGTSPTEPVTLATGALVLVATAALAAWIPARRAAYVAPAVALRGE